MSGRIRQALCLGAPSSGQGKTLVAAALSRYLRNQGLRVRVFKAGPDFLDPMILEKASGQPVYNLDGWMGGARHCRDLLHEAAAEADFILLEGLMGLFDGPSSTADLAEAFNLPVAAVIDAAGMGQSFGAIALGLARYRPNLRFHGAMANGVASERHAAMILEGVPDSLSYLGAFPRNSRLKLPSRHLGLVQAGEIAELDGLLDEAAEAIGKTSLVTAARAVSFQAAETPALTRSLQGVRIAVAFDAAFAFLYAANLDCLRFMGAELTFFSPLASQSLPACDAVYLPGGYPELFGDTLSANAAIQQELRAHVAAGKPLYAECGGMLYLMETLVDADGRDFAMVGLLPGVVTMSRRLAGLGYQSLAMPRGELRGHTFHYSRIDTALPPAAYGLPLRGGQDGEAFYRLGPIRASYLHLYFASQPQAAAALFMPD